MTTARRCILLILAALALALTALAPAADAAKPAKLGEKKARQILTGAERIAKKGKGTSGAAFAKTLNAQARHYDGYATKVRGGKCKVSIKKLSSSTRAGARAVKAHGPESPQYRAYVNKAFDFMTAVYKRCR